MSRRRIAIVTGALAPYTLRLYDAFAASHDVDLTVLVCERVEPQRQWILDTPKHFKVEVLSGVRKHISYTRHIYINPSVVPALRRLRPDLIMVEDFSPTMAIAATYARAARIPYGLKTDGHRGIDPGETSRIHSTMRRYIVPGAAFAVCASEDSVTFLEHWGLKPGHANVVPIVTPWDAPATVRGFHERPFDLLFAGGINEHIKGALFFADVVAALVQQGLPPRVRVAGEGPLRQELADRLSTSGVQAQFDGVMQADQMPEVFASTKVLMFPSRGDAWGLVANEAAICGTPVIGSPLAISSKRLVEAYGIGHMLPLSVETWATAAAPMISDAAHWQSFAQHRAAVVARFSLGASVASLARAFGAAALDTPLSAKPRVQAA